MPCKPKFIARVLLVAIIYCYRAGNCVCLTRGIDFLKVILIITLASLHLFIILAIQANNKKFILSDKFQTQSSYNTYFRSFIRLVHRECIPGHCECIAVQWYDRSQTSQVEDNIVWSFVGLVSGRCREAWSVAARVCNSCGGVCVRGPTRGRNGGLSRWAMNLGCLLATVSVLQLLQLPFPVAALPSVVKIGEWIQNLHFKGEGFARERVNVKF